MPPTKAAFLKYLFDSPSSGVNETDLNLSLVSLVKLRKILSDVNCEYEAEALLLSLLAFNESPGESEAFTRMWGWGLLCSSSRTEGLWCSKF